MLEMLALLEEREMRQRIAPCLSYRPHSQAQRLHGRPYSKRRCVVRGANKCGKTWMGWYESLAHVYGYRFWEVPGIQLKKGDLPPREDVDPRHWVRTGAGVPIPVPNKGMIVSGLKLLQGIGEVIWPLVEETVPPTVKGRWKMTRGPSGVPIYVRFPNGTEIYLASAEQEELGWEGSRIQWAWIDEPSKRIVYTGLWRGLSMDSGHIWFTLTPLGVRATWLYTDVIRHGDEDTLEIQVRQDDNPYFGREEQAAFRLGLRCSDAERAARLEGSWESLGSRIIHNFQDRPPYVVPSAPLPRDWLQGLTVDPHHVRPAAAAWWRLSPWGVYTFFREWPAGDFARMQTGALTPSGYANLFRSVEGAHPATVRICDPRFGKAEFSQHGTVQSAWADQMAEAGMPFDSRVPNTHRTEIGEQRIIEMLRYAPQFPVGPTNTPKIVVHDCCPNIRAALEHYGLVLNKDETRHVEKPSDEYKDFVDVIRYTVLYPIPIGDLGGQWGGAFTEQDLRTENQEGES